MLIANLALTDLLMATTSIPLTMVDIVYKYWPIGESMVSTRRSLFSSVALSLSDQVTITISITIDKSAELSTVKGKITTIEFSHFDIDIPNISRWCLLMPYPS